jgi:tetratricopeptide (TPR) repeat protein
MPDSGPAEHLRHLLNEIRVRTTTANRPMTFETIARRAGTGSAGYVSDVLKGKRLPEPATAASFARAMNATPGEVDRVTRLAGQARVVHAAKPVAIVVPRMLKPPPRGFVGRSDDVNVLSSLADLLHRGPRERTITRVSGMAGVGKTWFVLSWAHRNLTAFPDGQLYADLRGFSRGPGRARPPEVLPRFLRALGVASAPEDPDDQALLFQEITRKLRLLVVLDNVDGLDQIEPLLPDGPSTVVVTSRNHLRDLVIRYQAGAMQLAGLSDAEARALLRAAPVAARAGRDPHSVDELIRICAGLPMALSIVRSQAVIQSEWPLSEVVAFYRDAPAPVEAMTSAEESADLRRIFWSEYRSFSPEVRAAFHLLGLCPGVEVDLAGMASMLRRPPAEAADLLHTLVARSLLEQPARDRFRMHDLVWSFAAARAAAEVPPPEQVAARRRLATSLLAGAHSAQRELSPHRPAIMLDDPGPGVVALQPSGGAMEWFDAHYTALLALQRYAVEQGWDAIGWQLAWSLDDYHYRRGLMGAHERAWRTGLAAAERSGDPRATALARLCLGNILTRAARHDEATALLEAARAWFEEHDDVVNLAMTHRALQWGPDGRDELRHAEKALTLFRRHGDPVWIAIALNAYGETLVRCGHVEQARRHSEEALELHERLGNDSGMAATLDSLGIAATAAGDLLEAEARYGRAIELYLAQRNLSSAANTLVRLGEVLAATPGRTAEARATWDRAAGMLEEQGRDDEADRVRRRIAVR